MSIKEIDPERLLQFLRNSVLFHEADDASLHIIASRLESVKFHKGDPIILENEISDHVYFVYSGSVEVVKHLAELNQLSRVAILGAGSQFSEFSVLNRANKGASVFALENCELLRLSGATFLEILAQLPQVARKLVLHIGQMTHHMQTSSFSVEYVQPDKIALHQQILQIMPVKAWRKFEALPLRFDGRSLYAAVKDPQNQAFYSFIKNNNPNTNIYISLINNADFDVLEKELTTAYSSGQPIPHEPPKVAPQLSGEISEWLPKVSLFKKMPMDWFAELARHFTLQTFAQGQDIYRHGEISDKLYILHTGTVEVSLPVNDINNASVFFGSVQPGEYFSEVSMLTQNPHILSARAATDVKIYTLPKAVFDRLLETPFFTIPLACDLAQQFQTTRKASAFKFFDAESGVQVTELAALLPKSLVAQYEILPLKLKNNELTIGITNPESETIYSVISRYLHSYRVNLEVIRPADFKKWFTELNAVKEGSTAVVGRPTSANASRADAVTVLNEVLLGGFNDRASDIHIEPNSGNYIVRYRIDGVMRERGEKYSKELGAELVNRIKILSQIDMTNKFTPQDGQLKLDLQGQSFYARVSTLPTKRGENVVLRLIREKSSVPPLAMLAPDRRVINLFREVVGTRQGVFLVTGPTGSGKSTTLYSLLRELNRVEVSIISLEDPVEMEIAGTTQVEMSEKTGMTFAAALRSALRQDPNVIMIGEIRDEESAKIAFHAASTGHLVISTLHTNDSINVVPRLLELGVSRGMLASTLIGASAQRLLRQICKKCRDTKPITPAETETLKAELKSYELPPEMAYGKGCSHCGQSGFHGRIPIIEVWNKTKNVEAALAESTDLDVIYAELRKSGFETLREFAFKMACTGLTTVEEVLRAVGGFHAQNHEDGEKAA